MKKQAKKLDEDHPIIAKKINKSLNYSISEGSFSSASSSLGPSYFTPFALAVNATSSQIGVLNALISLIPPLIQIKTSKWFGNFSRKRVVWISVLLQTLMFLPLIAAGLLFIYGYTNISWIVLGLITLFYIVSAPTYPPWFSWMGSLVNEGERGKYFAKRNRINSFVGVIFMILGAVLLDKFRTAGIVLIGFSILFTIAFLARIICLRLLSKQYEPRLNVMKRNYFSFNSFMKNLKETPLGRFTIFTSTFRIAINIASPFFAVYLLKTLGLSYVWFMAITVSTIIFQLIFYPLMGKASDKFGNIAIIKFSALFVALTPLTWIISKNPYYLATVASFVAGLGWAGFNLTASNYIYDSLKQDQRSFGVSYANLLNGIGLFIGAGIGSILVFSNLPIMSGLLSLFFISGIARLGVLLYFKNFLKEVRHVKTFSPQYMVREFRPAQGVVREIHKLNHLKSEIQHYI